MSKTIDYIESQGFKVVGRYIHKRSSTTKQYKVAGQLNDTNFFFFSDNVHPFKAGVNFFNDKSIVDEPAHREYFKKIKETERNDFKVDFPQYQDTTKENSIFNTFLNETTREYLGKNCTNYFDLRGIKKGYMENSVCFPFFDIDNNFKTAQIIKYGSNGKRIKSGFSTNWYHSYKPIKQELKLKDTDKYAIKLDCFFGENYLKGSNNIVAIVEAPKTAAMLKEFFPNIDWLATAGEQNLITKNLKLLEDRKVVIFADAHTSAWKQIAESKGYNYCSILDNAAVEPGSDIADHLFDTESKIYTELQEYLFSLNAGFFNFELNKDLLDFDFNIIGKDKAYFTAVPYRYKGQEVLHQQDNSNEFNKIFKGKSFNIYEKKKDISAGKFYGYSILNANLDWHKLEKNKDQEELQQMDRKSFIKHLHKCYRTLKYLNEKKDYLEIFKTTLNTLLRDSNFSFNKVYVLERLVPMWDANNIDIDWFKRKRDWKYKGNIQLTRSEFEKQLNDDRFRSKLNMRLLALNDVLQENRFIDIETDLALNSYSKNRGYIKIFDIVREWNRDVIGSKTLKNYLSRQSFFDKLNNCTKSLPPHIEAPYRVANNWYSRLSISEISKLTGYKNRSYIKQWVMFETNKDTTTVLKKEVKNLLSVIHDIEPMRNEVNGKTRIYTFEYIKTVNDLQLLQRNQLNHKQAFLTKESLLKDLIKTDSETYAAAIKGQVKYLNYLDTLNKKRDTERVFSLTDSYLNNEFQKYYNKDKLLKKVVNI